VTHLCGKRISEISQSAHLLEDEFCLWLPCYKAGQCGPIARLAREYSQAVAPHESQMPLYTVSAQEGVLTREGKAGLAAEITDFHCKLTGLDRAFVKILFDTYPSGDGFVAGEAAPAAILTVLIRIGRSTDYKRAMAQNLWNILKRATRAPDTAMLVAIQEAPPSQAMEMGQIMPELP
jgi:phenylpyruvate tautomerase PptA (4-oxalocrotonate tautomerase family)